MAFTHAQVTLQHLGLTDDYAMLFGAPRVAGLRHRRVLHQPVRPRAQHAAASRISGATAFPAICRSCWCRVTEAERRSAGAPAPAGAGILARQGPARRRRDPQRASRRLSRRDAASSSRRCSRSPDGPAGRTGPAACSCCGRTACARTIAICCRPLRAWSSRRARRAGAAARSPGPVAARRSVTAMPAGIAAPEPADRAGGRAAARDDERDRRLHARRTRVHRGARRRSRNAAAVVERPGEPGVRHDGQQRGAAFTWAENSRENRLTPFANDPVADPTGEAIFLRDEDSGEVWGATPGPLPRGRSPGGG